MDLVLEAVHGDLAEHGGDGALDRSGQEVEAVVDGQTLSLEREGGFWVLHLPARPAAEATVINFR